MKIGGVVLRTMGIESEAQTGDMEGRVVRLLEPTNPSSGLRARVLWTNGVSSVHEIRFLRLLTKTLVKQSNTTETVTIDTTTKESEGRT